MNPWTAIHSKSMQIKLFNARTARKFQARARACLSILRTQLVAGLQFRAAAWAKISTFIFYGLIHVVMILIFYQFGRNSNAESIGGMTVTQAVTYIWLTQIIAHLLPMMGGDNEVWEKIRSGDISVELCRPLDLYFHWFCRAAATRLAPFLLQLLPVTIIAVILPEPYRMHGPVSLAGLLTCILTLGMGLLLSCACVGITYALMLKVSWGEGPVYIMFIITDILSGGILPLQLWPEWMQGFLSLQPFAGLIDLPIRLYLGTAPPEAIWRVMALQLFWFITFTAAGWLWMRRNLLRVVVQGG